MHKRKWWGEMSYSRDTSEITGSEFRTRQNFQLPVIPSVHNLSAFLSVRQVAGPYLAGQNVADTRVDIKLVISAAS